MKLKRIDAIRFGALEGACLDGVGDGLTIVLGPNESGKSTYTALVRSVLFGFPMGRGKAGDRFYRPVAGERAARLTFADEAGEWAVDRVEGKHGGPVSVTALRGPERRDLLAGLLGDMNEQTYRVVFGFGVDELDDIENGDDPHLRSRLYAAGAGLETNPLDVRDALLKEAADLFKPGGRVSAVNKLAGEMKDVRDEIRSLEAEATAFADEQERAVRLGEELEPLRARRDELEQRLRSLERDAQRAEDLALEIASLGDRVRELEDAMAVQKAVVEAAAPDERALAVAAEVDSLLEEQSAWRQRLDAARGYREAADDARRRLAALGDLPDVAVDPAEARARVDAWTTRRAQLEGEIGAADRRAATAGALEGQLLDVPAAGRGASARRIRGMPAPAWVACGTGVLFAVAGALLQQWLAVALGVLLAITGAAVAIAGGRSSSAPDTGAAAQRAAADARMARAEAEAARATLKAEEAVWSSWLETAGLRGRGDDPVAVRALLDALRERDVIAADTDRQSRSAADEEAAADSWVRRLAGLVEAFVEVPGPLNAEEVLGVAARAREAVARAREAAGRRERATESLAGLAVDLERTIQRRVERAAGLETVAAAHGVAVTEALPELETLAARTSEDLAEARLRVDGLAEDLATLRGKLDAGGRDAAMALARQRLEGLGALASEAADRYSVIALAIKLLDRSRERYERERQPEVTRIAGHVFSQMTSGRYSGIRVPIDGSEISVETPSGALKPTNELSTGTAQQLYLALRVGFLASLDAGRFLPVLMDDVVVNFDAERRAGAALAIAELSRERQVVFFTCHEETAASLAAAVPDATRVVLERCELRG